MSKFKSGHPPNMKGPAPKGKAAVPSNPPKGYVSKPYYGVSPVEKLLKTNMSEFAKELFSKTAKTSGTSPNFQNIPKHLPLDAVGPASEGKITIKVDDDQMSHSLEELSKSLKLHGEGYLHLGKSTGKTMLAANAMVQALNAEKLVYDFKAAYPKIAGAWGDMLPIFMVKPGVTITLADGKTYGSGTQIPAQDVTAQMLMDETVVQVAGKPVGVQTPGGLMFTMDVESMDPKELETLLLGPGHVSVGYDQLWLKKKDPADEVLDMDYAAAEEKAVAALIKQGSIKDVMDLLPLVKDESGGLVFDNPAALVSFLNQGPKPMKIEIDYKDLETILEFAPAYKEMTGVQRHTMVRICASIHLARETIELEKKMAAEKEKAKLAEIYADAKLVGGNMGPGCKWFRVTWVNSESKVSAIKALREVSKLGLKEAKDVVDHVGEMWLFLADPQAVHAMMLGSAKQYLHLQKVDYAPEPA